MDPPGIINKKKDGHWVNIKTIIEDKRFRNYRCPKNMQFCKKSMNVCCLEFRRTYQTWSIGQDIWINLRHSNVVMNHDLRHIQVLRTYLHKSHARYFQEK